jgi:NAD(P)-dependent dehydrogenase (short-subunit alcohol dehydrogenase family)
MKRLEGKAALVTGAASGMGKAAAIRLAADGAEVALGDINFAGAQETAEIVRAAGGRATPIEYDASQEAACVALVEQAVDAMGKLDIVANVAGISAFYRLDETTAEIFNRFLAVNLTSTLVICRESVPHLKKTRGCLINFSSINGRLPVAFHAAYDASKAGVLAITKGIAQEFSPDGIRCNAICPGFIDTPMNVDNRMPHDIDLRMIAKLSSPLIEPGRPEEVAGVVSFLASEDASYVNGEQIVVDGGLTSII